MLPEFSTLFTFILASAAIVAVPGPSLSIIIANSLKHGTRAGITNIIGGQLGLLILVGILALGLEALTTTLAWLFDWVRLAGAAYLIWLGYKLWRSNGTLGTSEATKGGNSSSLFWQGFLVSISNPKVLLFFGAFLPQFIDPTANTALQTVWLGLVFMVVATIIDSGYAFAAGRAGSMLTKKRVRAVEVSSGSLMIGGGLWIALSRN
ncbi:MAG: LysE family translocator [Rhizobiaceae bacterium]